MKRRGGSGGINEDFDFSDMSDVDYTDVFSDIDAKAELVAPLHSLAAAILSDCTTIDSRGAYGDGRDGIEITFAVTDDDDVPLGVDDYGNVIVRLDIDMKKARDVYRADGTAIITPPPYRTVIALDLSRGALAGYAAGGGKGWCLRPGRLFNRGIPVKP